MKIYRQKTSGKSLVWALPFCVIGFLFAGCATTQSESNTVHTCDVFAWREGSDRFHTNTPKTIPHPLDITRYLDVDEAMDAWLDAVPKEVDQALLAAASGNVARHRHGAAASLGGPHGLRAMEGG